VVGLERTIRRHVDEAYAFTITLAPNHASKNVDGIRFKRYSQRTFFKGGEEK
jgi:hypothetical protein